MNKFIKIFFTELNAINITYCHWKSNNNLDSALDGIDDLDILVSINDTNKFKMLLNRFSFKLALERAKKHDPYIYHYYSLDPATGLIVHLHVYYKIVTAGSILKNYKIPIEEMLFEERFMQDELVSVPSREADFILFILRKHLEFPSAIEHYLFVKDYHNIKKEFDWLFNQVDFNKVNLLLKRFLPLIPTSFFDKCVDVLRQDKAIFKRYFLGVKLSLALSAYKLKPSYKASIVRFFAFFFAYIKPRIKYKRKSRYLFPGGQLIAFTGSEACGKSTLSTAVENWLSVNFDTIHIHLGKPKKHIITRPIWMLIKLYVKLKKAIWKNADITHTNITNQDVSKKYTPNVLLSVLDSIDRYFALKKCSREAARGAFVLTDRYPAKEHGLIDGPRITLGGGNLSSLLAKIENSFYKKMVSPDLLFKFFVPLDLALQRNQARNKPEPEDFVKMRHSQFLSFKLDDIDSVDVDTSLPIEDCLFTIKKHIWGLVI